MSVDDNDNEDGAQECPYCSSTSGCVHVLLLVDRTFRTAEGGALMRAFNDRWSKLCEEGGDDFDEREPFDGLLDEVDACADPSAEYDHEGEVSMKPSPSGTWSTVIFRRTTAAVAVSYPSASPQGLPGAQCRELRTSSMSLATGGSAHEIRRGVSISFYVPRLLEASGDL